MMNDPSMHNVSRFAFWTMRSLHPCNLKICRVRLELRSLLCAGFVTVISAALAAAAERSVDYNRDVRPILSENCFACHGFDEAAREADLRLDVAESALASRDGLPAIVAGDSAASEAWRRISSDD